MGSTNTEIFSKRQKVCLLEYNSTIDHKGHLLGEPCTTGVHQEAGQQCETPRKGRKTATLWSNATTLHNMKLNSRPTCNKNQIFCLLLKMFLLVAPHTSGVFYHMLVPGGLCCQWPCWSGRMIVVRILLTYSEYYSSTRFPGKVSGPRHC